MKSAAISFIFVLILSMPIALATSVYTDYSGTGDFLMSTVITSAVTPTITDTVEAHTGCESLGDCCPTCISGDGNYSGTETTSNDPFTWSVDHGEVENGCLSLTEEIVEYNGDQIVMTTYSTVVEGTGYAYSAISNIFSSRYSYQYGQGSGNIWAYINQNSTIGDEFDFDTMYGMVAYQCDNGYVLLISEYELTGYLVSHGPASINALCENQGIIYSRLYSNTTDVLVVNATTTSETTSWFVGTSIYGNSVMDMKTIMDEPLNMTLEMVLG